MPLRRPLLAACLLLSTPAFAQVARPADRLSFQEAISRALEKNPTLQTAVAELDRSRALLMQARALSLPTLTGNGYLTHLDAARAFGGTVDVPQNQIGGTLTLAVPLFVPAQWRNWEHASDSVAISLANSEEARREIALATGQAWLEIFTEMRIVEVDLRAQADDQAHVDYARTRFEGGLGNRVDLVSAQQQVAAALAQLEGARTGLALAREALGVLVGSDGPVDVQPESALPELPGEGEALDGVMSKRADLRALKLKERLALSIQHDAWTDYVPTLYGTVAPFYQDPPNFAQPYTGYEGQLLLVWTFFDGGARFGAERANRALALEARLTRENAAREANADIRAGYEGLVHADAALVAAREAARLARERLELANDAWKAGQTTNLEVIDAERTALDAETAAAVAEDTERQAKLVLLAASGRFP